MKHKIIITNIPAFYKINLYNEINKTTRLTVIFTSANESDRNKDFIKGEMFFDNIFLSGSTFSKFLKLIYFVKSNDYDELIIGYWDSIILVLLAFLTPLKKNSFIVESSYYESRLVGLKGIIKRLFMMRISKVYASGRSQRRITDNLGFKGKTIITKGVGVFNYIQQIEYTPRKEVKNFIYVGRYVEVKNLRFLIEVFNELPHFNLYLAGFGEQEDLLKSMAKDNIHFLGAIDNDKLTAVYQKMDVFVLPSKVEPWGLVVEEALNNGIPVIISDKVGCAEEIIDASNGLIFHYDNKQELTAAISRISNLSFYNKLRENISKLDFESVEKRQILCYVD